MCFLKTLILGSLISAYEHTPSYYLRQSMVTGGLMKSLAKSQPHGCWIHSFSDLQYPGFTPGSSMLSGLQFVLRMVSLPSVVLRASDMADCFHQFPGSPIGSCCTGNHVLLNYFEKLFLILCFLHITRQLTQPILYVK